MKRQKEAMTFLEHLEDFRGLIIRCAGVLLVGCVVVGCFFPVFARLLNYPLRVALGEEPELLQGLVTTSPMGIFSVLIQVCFMGGFAIALPFMLYFAAQFIVPGLSEKERALLLPSCLGVFILFLGGGAFSYFYVLPVSLKVAIGLNQVFGFQLIWSAPHYYGLVVWMTLGVGLCFEFPLFLLMMVYLEIVSSKRLKEVRRYAIVGVLIVAALITPSGDPFSLGVLAIPLYILYELTLVIGSRIEVARDKRRLQAIG